MTITETKIINQLNDKARGYYVASGSREVAACLKLIVKGLAKQVSVASGTVDVYSSQFGYTNTVKRQIKVREIKIVANN